MSDNHPIDRLLDGLHRDPGEGELVRHTPLINRIFSRGSVEEILEGLDSEQGEDETFARETAAEIRKKSPTSLKIAFGQFERGKSLSLTDALKLEFRLASHVIASHDYREGIAARIAGKAARPTGSRQPSRGRRCGHRETVHDPPATDELELRELTPGL